MLDKKHNQIREKKYVLLVMITLLWLIALSSCQQGRFVSRMNNPLSKSDEGKTDLLQDQISSPSPEDQITSEPTSQPATLEIPRDNDEGEKITLKILFDNYPFQKDLETGWGFSAFITYKDHNVLFDTGADGKILLDNMDKMDLSPHDVQSVVLSHEHNDHTGGLDALLSAGAKPDLYLLPTFSRSFKVKYKNQLDVIEVVLGQPITERISSTGEIIGSPPEQALVIDTTQGLVVITGCAHPGVEKMVLEAKRQYKEDIYMVLGGFHLGNTSSYQVDQIINELQRLNVKYIGPCHCTGDQAINQIKEAFGEDFIMIGAGKVIEIEL